jgi:hypothetical protein
VLKLAESYAREKGADIRQRGVLEESEELRRTVAVDGASDVVWVEVEIE